MENTELITDPNFSIMKLAEVTGYSYKLVSQVINDKIGKNFKTLLGEYRVREACRRLLDKEGYGNYTIEHVARSVGFLSRSRFSITFKSVVGISPSDFQRNARADSDASA